MALPELPQEGELNWFGKRDRYDRAIGDLSERAFQNSVEAKDDSSNAINRVEQLEIVGGLEPGNVSDATMANVALDSQSNFYKANQDIISNKVWDVPGPTGTQQGDADIVVGACIEASTLGRKTVRLGPGHYQLDNLTPDDIYNRYLLGDDRVTFTDNSYVYPFREGEITALASQSGNSGGRGRVSIFADDAPDIFWTRLFPFTKELGFTLATAWHTDDDRPWLKEARRHGWEICHHLPENITAPDYLSNGELDDAIQSGLDRFEEYFGTRDGWGFVYPKNQRTLETDRVASKYFIYGRGVRYETIYPQDTPNPWATSAHNLDNEISTGSITKKAERLLDLVSMHNGDMSFFIHLNSVNVDDRLDGLREFINLCRDKGIEIVNPKQMWSDRNIIEDSYLEDYESPAMDTSRFYHGTRSMKQTAFETSGFIPGHISIGSKPGLFGVYRLSARYSSDAEIEVNSPGLGLNFRGAFRYRDISDPSNISSPIYKLADRLVPNDDTNIIPTSNWGRVQTLTYLGPDIYQISPRVTVDGMIDGELWMDEIKIQHVGWASEVKVQDELTGTATHINVPVPNVARYNILVIPDRTPNGDITWEENIGRIAVFSSATETNLPITIVVKPKTQFSPDELISEGA